MAMKTKPPKHKDDDDEHDECPPPLLTASSVESSCSSSSSCSSPSSLSLCSSLSLASSSSSDLLLEGSSVHDDNKVVAIHELYTQDNNRRRRSRCCAHPPPIIEEQQQHQQHDDGSWDDGSSSSNNNGCGGTIKRLLMTFLLLIMVGCAIDEIIWRWHHRSHGSYLPSRIRIWHGASSSSPPPPLGSTTTNEDDTNPPAPIMTPPDQTSSTTLLQQQQAQTLHQITLQKNLLDLQLQMANEENEHLRMTLLTQLLSSHKLHQSHSAYTAQVELHLRGAAKFQLDQVVEQVYNANTIRNRILYPFRIVEIHLGNYKGGSSSHVIRANGHDGRIHRLNEHAQGYYPDEYDDDEDDYDLEEEDSDDEDEDDSDDEGDNDPSSSPQPNSIIGIRYTILRLLDGFIVHQIPESFLRQYIPYDVHTKALCNVGGYGIGKERMVPCLIEEYVRFPHRHHQKQLKLKEEQEQQQEQQLMKLKEDQSPPPPQQHPTVRTKSDTAEEEEVFKSEYRVRLKREGEAEEVEDLLSMGNIQRMD